MIKKLSLFLVCMAFLFSCSKEDPNSLNEKYYHESYRFQLWTELTLNNWQVDFLGTRQDLSKYPGFFNFLFDRDHEGISGITSKGVLRNLNNVLYQAGVPDVVLLGIGGNDLLQGESIGQTTINISKIIDKLQKVNPRVVIFIEQIAPAKAKSGHLALIKNLKPFNDQIAQLAIQKTNEKSKVIAVDMFSNWSNQYFSDDLHYNILGAKEVASRYFKSMSRELIPNNFYNILALGDSRVEGNRP